MEQIWNLNAMIWGLYLNQKQIAPYEIKLKPFEQYSSILDYNKENIWKEIIITQAKRSLIHDSWNGMQQR